jgi:hypothetical protein
MSRNTGFSLSVPSLVQQALACNRHGGADFSLPKSVSAGLSSASEREPAAHSDSWLLTPVFLIKGVFFASR